MKSLVNKIAASLFLFSGFIPVLFTMFFLIRQQSLRHEMKEKLEQELLHNISVPQSKLVWINYKKEILVDGKMFDIKSSRLENGQYHFTGLFDDEETALNDYFEKHSGQKSERDNGVLSSLFQLLQSLYPATDHQTPISQNEPPVYCCLILSNIQSPTSEILTPPPQA